MSLFVNSLKTFTETMTGHNYELKVNNAIWIIMKAKFKMTQSEWQKMTETEENVSMARLAACVFMANGHEVTEKEILENTDAAQLADFMMAYQGAMFERYQEIPDEERVDEKKE